MFYWSISNLLNTNPRRLKDYLSLYLNFSNAVIYPLPLPIVSILLSIFTWSSIAPCKPQIYMTNNSAEQRWNTLTKQHLYCINMHDSINNNNLHNIFTISLAFLIKFWDHFYIYTFSYIGWTYVMTSGKGLTVLPTTYYRITSHIRPGPYIW